MVTNRIALVVRRLLICCLCCTALSGVVLSARAESLETAYKKNGVTIEYGNAAQGYVLIKYEKPGEVLKVRVTRGVLAYTYDLNGQNQFEAFPLQMGDGAYKIQVMTQVRKSGYRLVAEKTITVALEDPNAPFLCPSQYVNYTENSKAAAKSNELCQGLLTDAEKVRAIYAFCRHRIYYDYIARPKSGYVPDIDSVLDTSKGICLDYAALMAGMLRVQGIPTKLVIGYADRTYHAWNNVLLDGKWYRLDATLASASIKAEVYREERYY